MRHLIIRAQSLSLFSTLAATATLLAACGGATPTGGDTEPAASGTAGTSSTSSTSITSGTTGAGTASDTTGTGSTTAASATGGVGSTNGAADSGLTTSGTNGGASGSNVGTAGTTGAATGASIGNTAGVSTTNSAGNTSGVSTTAGSNTSGVSTSAGGDTTSTTGCVAPTVPPPPANTVYARNAVAFDPSTISIGGANTANSGSGGSGGVGSVTTTGGGTSAMVDLMVGVPAPSCSSLYDRPCSSWEATIGLPAALLTPGTYALGGNGIFISSSENGPCSTAGGSGGGSGGGSVTGGSGCTNNGYVQIVSVTATSVKFVIKGFPFAGLSASATVDGAYEATMCAPGTPQTTSTTGASATTSAGATDTTTSGTANSSTTGTTSAGDTTGAGSSSVGGASGGNVGTSGSTG